MPKSKKSTKPTKSPKKTPAKKKVIPKKRGLKGELDDLAKILSGELKLRMEEERLQKIKAKAIELHKDEKRKRVVKGEEVMEKDDPTNKKVVQNIDLYEWEAPIRFKTPFEPRTFFIIVALCLLFILFLAVLGHYGLMASIIALLFFVYVAGTTDPINVKHKVTTRGIDTIDKLYEWFMLDEFWFTEKDGQSLLIVTTKLRIPPKLLMLASKKDRAALFVLLQDKLLYREVKKQGRVEKMSWGEYVPLEEV